MNVESVEEIHVTGKLQLPIYYFAQNSQAHNKFLWTPSATNISQIRQKGIKHGQNLIYDCK